MRFHHLSISLFLVSIIPSTSKVAASNGGGGVGIARFSTSDGVFRPGRLLRSSLGRDDADDSRIIDGDSSSSSSSPHHGRLQLTLLDAVELIEAASIELALPPPHSFGHEDQDQDDVLYTFDIDWRDESGGGWHGRLRQKVDDEVATIIGTAHFFAASKGGGLQENRLAGMIHRGDGTTLRITTKPDGTHWFESWDDDSLDSKEMHASKDNEEDESDSKDNKKVGNKGRDLQEVANFGDDDGSIIDHLSVYTRRAMCEHALVGFYPCPPNPYIRAPIEEFIALQITTTNYVLANTHVPTRLNSVHIFMDPEYDQVLHAAPIAAEEEDRSEISVALSHLKTQGSGHLEEARKRQNMHCADIVTLFATIGLGLAGGPYNVVNHGSGGWGFAHEIGHSINAGHRNDNAGKTGYGYGYGYGPDSSDPSYYATIMAFGGKKVPMYSTPDYTWEGKIVGTATENNRQSIIDDLIKSANRRRSEQCLPTCEYGSDGTPLGCPTTCSKCHFPPDFCYDDPLFRYEDNVEKHCEWVRFNTHVCDKTVSIVDGQEMDVKDRCPVSCNACPTSTPAPSYPPNPSGDCGDDSAFLKNNRGCDWVANSMDTSCGDNAGDGYPDGKKIYDYCRLTCNMCHIDKTPPPSPTPCADIPGNHFQSDTKDCTWIGEKIDPRCTKYSKAATHCAETCGLCNAPTSAPTARGPCADDESWVYEAPEDKYSFLNCAWVREDREDRCQHSKMKHFCPVTCGTCCEDEPGWYKGINSGGDNYEKDCAYFGVNGCSNAANEHCPRTCGLCLNYLANAGGPDPDIGRVRHLRIGASS